jgi:class 3 adenylate cyclase/tetratricopeptide (TPR) repeat protein
VHHDVRDARYRLAHAFLDHAGQRVRFGERRVSPESEREERDETVVRSHEAKLPRRGSRLGCDDSYDGIRVDERLPTGGCFGERLQVCPHVLDLGHGGENRALDLLGDVVRAFQLEVAWKLQVERDLHAPVHVQDAEVVDLPNLRDPERGRQHPLADLRPCPPRLDVHHDVDRGKPFAKCVLDTIRGGVALTHGGARSDADDDVRKVPASRLTYAEPPQLHGWVERVDRRAGCVFRVDRSPVHEHVHVAAEKAHRSRDDEGGDEQRSERVALGEAERDGRQPGEHRERAGEVAPEVERVREERVAAIATRCAQRHRRPRGVDDDDERDRRERPPRRVHGRVDRSHETRHREARDDDADQDQERGLGERREMLGLPVTPRVAGVGRTDRNRDGEEGEQRSREIGSRVRRLREEPETPAREPSHELDRDQQAGGAHGDEGGPALRRHGGRLERRPILPLVKVCESCGRENADDARFCSQCATPLEAQTATREERKVVTCLFCDLVGFTARAERMDPEDVRLVLQPYHARVRSELERRGGTVEKFIGDAVMAVFGAPTAHEDDPERAIRAALSIRDTMVEEGTLAVRIGITTGEALIALGARPDAGEGMASGDVVNTAARLQSAAPVNGILVDDMTSRATERVIAYREMPAVEAKGKVDPVPAWEALEAKARFGVDVRQLGASPLVGRETELDGLAAALNRARREREPQLVTLVGVPGIGKSRLVWELFQYVDSEPELTFWRQGRSLPYGEGVSFWALAEIVKAQAGILETDGAREVAAKLHAAVAALGGDEDPSWLELHLRPLVGLEASGGLVDSRTESFAAWRRFFESLADERTLVLVFEDLHWADDALLDFVDHLVEWASNVPLLVVATARPELLERRPGWSGGKPNAITLSLRPLSHDETSELVHALLAQSVLPAEAQAELLARAAGNPLYAEEFARLLAAGRSPDELPESVQGLIAARLDTLSEEAKALLQAAAVVGKVFWLGSVSTVAGVRRWTAEQQLHALERKEFVRRERRSSVAGETEYGFKHILVRDVAYGQIPRAERAELHRLAAQWIESLGRPDDHAETLAHHYLSALELARAAGSDDSSLVDRTRAVAREAGDRALSLNAFPAAARFYAQALELSGPDDPDHPPLLLRHGRALHHAADPRAEHVLEEASRELVATGNPEAAAQAHLLLCELWWDRGKRDESDEQLNRARALVGVEASETAVRVLGRHARAQMIAGDNEDALSAGMQALDLAERLGLDDVLVHVLSTVGSARFYLGDPAGISDLERSVEVALGIGSHLSANNLNNLGFMQLLAGDIRPDRELRNKALREGARFGDERIIRFVRGALPPLDFYLGRWEEATEEADTFIAECEAGSPHYMESNVRWSRALMRLAQGDREGAASDALRAEEQTRESRDPQMLLPALAVRLRVETEHGATDAAAALAGEILTAAPAHAARPAALELAWNADRLATATAVREWIDRIRYESLWSEAARAILDDDLGRAADLFARIGSLPDEAYTRLRGAEQLVAEGRRAEADEQLRPSMAFWRSVGATRYILEGEALLAKTA